MGVSFRVSRTGTRYRHKTPSASAFRVQDDDETQNDAVPANKKKTDLNSSILVFLISTFVYISIFPTYFGFFGGCYHDSSVLVQSTHAKYIISSKLRLNMRNSCLLEIWEFELVCISLVLYDLVLLFHVVLLVQGEISQNKGVSKISGKRISAIQF